MVVLGELYYGALRARTPEREVSLIRDFLTIAVVLLPDEKTSAWYGEVKAGLASAGRLIPENDIWIAAIARQYDLPLATRDNHFEAVPALTVLPW